MKVRAEQIQEQAADHFPQLVRNFEGFQTAQGINYSLSTFTNSWPRTVSPLTVPPFSPISPACFCAPSPKLTPTPPPRSEEHTSELQSRVDLVCRLLLEKKNTNNQ